MVSESTHWYQPNGDEAYTQIVKSGKNKGKERNTTLRDAKKQGNLYPSVTTIMGIMDKPALTTWKVEQSLKAAYEMVIKLQHKPDEYYVDYKEWREDLREFDAAKQAKDAADEGTRIHGVLEKFFASATGETPQGDDYLIVSAVLRAMNDAGMPLTGYAPEKSCVSPHGFAGKVDLHSGFWVIDFKTKDGDLTNVKLYPDQIRQLSAYREALEINQAQCANIFISRDTVDDEGMPIVKIIIHKPEQSDKGWLEFHAIVKLWQVLKGYKPC